MNNEMNVDEFKERLKSASDLSAFAQDVLLNGTAKHVSLEQIDLISKRVASSFSIPHDDLRVIIVGSAKLGFSISEKFHEGVVVKTRYRDYVPFESDVDVAIVSERLFLLLWKELSAYAYRHEGFPHHFRKVGSYIVGGWFRIDCINRVGLIRCEKWVDIFRQLSRDKLLGKRRIRGALYYSLDLLNQYQQRALRNCISGV